MRVRRHHLALVLGLGAVWGTALFVGCKAGVNDGTGGFGGSTGTNAKGSTTGTGDQSASSGFNMDAGDDAPIDVPINPCGTKCGPVELCGGENKGIDDNCNGVVDEGCPCSPGEAESCFKGDPSYLASPGCHAGTQKCSENGAWEACAGGSHATEMCFNADPLGCHPISGVPFATVDLKPGTGNFSGNADTGSSDWSIACPPGVNPCPTVDANGNVQVLVSGEYTVTYTKNVMGVPEMCTYPLYVGAPGLRVEVSWDFPTSGGATDLDLHMHEPGTTTPWGQGSNQDCGYSNCTADNFDPFFSFGPEWFPQPPQPADSPVAWDDLGVNLNTCYYSPRGAGAQWQSYGKGCHNPRLDLDNISCTPSVTDPQSFSFCAPENINVDVPPKDKWMRIGVHYFPSTSSYPGPTHPVVKIYCDGALAAELGNHGFNNPEIPIAWNLSTQVDQFWSVADVKFKQDQCSKECIVKPIYVNNDATARMPVYASESTVSTTFAPPYPP